jgi:hypothetical protein
MPMRTEDGLVHNVETPQEKNYRGVLTCGLLYGASKEPLKDFQTARGVQVVHVVRVYSHVTCLWCVVRRNRSR